MDSDLKRKADDPWQHFSLVAKGICLFIFHCLQGTPTLQPNTTGINITKANIIQ